MKCTKALLQLGLYASELLYLCNVENEALEIEDRSAHCFYSLISLKHCPKRSPSQPQFLDITYHNVVSSTYSIFMNLHFAVGEGARQELPTPRYKSFLCEVGHQQTIYNH